MLRKIVCSFLFLFVFLGADVNPSRSVIVFDFGGVLAGSSYNLTCEHIAKRLHISFDQAQQMMKIYKQAKDLGFRVNSEFWRQYGAGANILLPKDWNKEFDDIRRHTIALFPGMMELVRALKEKKYRVAMLSNVTSKRAQAIRELGLYDPFNPAVLSCDIRVSKPSKHAFIILLNLMPGVKARDCIFIDDKVENIEVAKKMGFDGIQFISRNQLVRELIKRGIKVH